MLKTFFVTEKNTVYPSVGFQLLQNPGKVIAKITTDSRDYEISDPEGVCDISTGVAIQLTVSLRAKKPLEDLKYFRSYESIVGDILMGNSPQHTAFLIAWEGARKVQFDGDWNNDTGYYDGATDDEKLNLQRGELVATVSNTANNRKLLIKGLGKGLNIVIFERYTAGQHGILVQNKPSRRLSVKEKVLVPAIGDSALSLADVELFLSFE